MPYVTSWERIAEERGKKIGEEIGKRRGEEIGEERGEEIGEERGIEKGKLQTARKLVKRGVDIDIIAEATGFSREQIEKLTTEVHL
jgi:predicted transposase/invertase (TIGR01784 family)